MTRGEATRFEDLVNFPSPSRNGRNAILANLSGVGVLPYRHLIILLTNRSEHCVSVIPVRRPPFRRDARTGLEESDVKLWKSQRQSRTLSIEAFNTNQPACQQTP